jgi:hypothetical protein
MLGRRTNLAAMSSTRPANVRSVDTRTAEWRLTGGIFGSHHTYERVLADETRLLAQVRGNGGAPRVVSLRIDRDPVSASALRQAGIDALETALADETLGDRPAYLATWCGISPRERVRRSRGRPELRTDSELRELVKTVLARQEAGVNATDLSDVQPWRLSPRRVRELLKKAASRRLVTIQHTPGRRNIYVAPDQHGRRLRRVPT